MKSFFILLIIFQGLSVLTGHTSGQVNIHPLEQVEDQGILISKRMLYISPLYVRCFSYVDNFNNIANIKECNLFFLSQF